MQDLEVPLQAIWSLDDINVCTTVKAIMHCCELIPCVVSKKKCDAGDHKGESMMSALCVLRYAKRHLSG